MTFSCPQPPDMDDCKSKKKRCLSGPCVGLAYTEGEECSGSGTFDPYTCQCEVQTPPGVYLVTITGSGDTLADTSTHYTYWELGEPFITTDGKSVEWSIGFSGNANGKVCQQESECGRQPCGPGTGRAAWTTICADGGLMPFSNPSEDPCGNAFSPRFMPGFIPSTYTEGLCSSLCASNPDYSGIPPILRIKRSYHDGINYEDTSDVASTPDFDRVSCNGVVAKGPATYTIGMQYIGPGNLCDYYVITCDQSKWTGTTPLIPR